MSEPEPLERPIKATPFTPEELGEIQSMVVRKTPKGRIAQRFDLSYEQLDSRLEASGWVLGLTLIPKHITTVPIKTKEQIDGDK